MRRHAFGLIGFAASTTLSWALVLPFAASAPPGAPATVRTYWRAPLGWSSRGAGVSSRTKMYRCSDGSRLFVVREDYGSPRQARAAFDVLVELARPSVAARNLPRDGALHAYLIFARDRIYDPERPPDMAHTAYAVAWVEGSSLNAIYGPTMSHVMELESAELREAPNRPR
jgi:hypothetical protein